MVDVCLVVEGNYPYAVGGVSAWADGLLRGLGDVSFAVAHVRAADAPAAPAAYETPGGVEIVHVDVEPGQLRPPADAHEALPDARVYHATSTGTCGEIARAAAKARGAGLAVTEHGIAWRDTIEITNFPKSHFVRPDLMPKAGSDAHLALIRESFALARGIYADADAVTSVCGPNAAVQALAGAARERLAVIPNPVDPAGPAVTGDGFLAAFVGRVAPEKDVETFLRAAALVAAERADARFAVVGPLDQDPAYADRCLSLSDGLGLGERIAFTGTTDTAPWYARMDALALTSRTEAQPLVALEAMAAGVPVVATDVGGCREAIGDAGLLTAAGDPPATARALLALASDELLRARLGRNGRRRAALRHDPERVYGAYRELYDRLAA